MSDLNKLHEQLTVHILRRDEIAGRLREVETEIIHCRMSIARAVAHNCDPHVLSVASTEGVTP